MGRMEDENTEPSNPFEMPLFPLNTVLYPGMILPLHIFEERYRTMIGSCIETQQPFGIILIKEGSEVGAPATPERIGTTTRILESQTLSEGRLNILTRGDKRFELLDIVQKEPHLVGRVQLLAEDDGGTTPTQVNEAQGEFEVYLRDMARLAGETSNDVMATQEPVELSYSIASKLCSSVKLPPDVRQHWLELESANTRLDSITMVLRGLNEALAQEIKRRASDVGLN